jgi:hypothetical protein
MPSSGMWRRVDLVWTDILEKRIASIFRVEKSASEEPAWAGGCSLEASSKAFVAIYKATRRHILEVYHLYNHSRHNVKYYNYI